MDPTSAQPANPDPANPAPGPAPAGPAQPSNVPPDPQPAPSQPASFQPPAGQVLVDERRFHSMQGMEPVVRELVSAGYKDPDAVRQALSDLNTLRQGGFDVGQLARGFRGEPAGGQPAATQPQQAPEASTSGRWPTSCRGSSPTTNTPAA